MSSKIALAFLIASCVLLGLSQAQTYQRGSHQRTPVQPIRKYPGVRRMPECDDELGCPDIGPPEESNPDGAVVAGPPGPPGPPGPAGPPGPPGPNKQKLASGVHDYLRPRKY